MADRNRDASSGKVKMHTFCSPKPTLFSPENFTTGDRLKALSLYDDDGAFAAECRETYRRLLDPQSSRRKRALDDDDEGTTDDFKRWELESQVSVWETRARKEKDIVRDLQRELSEANSEYERLQNENDRLKSGKSKTMQLTRFSTNSLCSFPDKIKLPAGMQYAIRELVDLVQQYKSTRSLRPQAVLGNPSHHTSTSYGSLMEVGNHPLVSFLGKKSGKIGRYDLPGVISHPYFSPNIPGPSVLCSAKERRVV